MPAIAVAAAQDLKGAQKGEIIDLFRVGADLGRRVMLPDYIVVTVTDRDLTELQRFNQQVRKFYNFENETSPDPNYRRGRVVVPLELQDSAGAYNSEIPQDVVDGILELEAWQTGQDDTKTAAERIKLVEQSTTHATYDFLRPVDAKLVIETINDQWCAMLMDRVYYFTNSAVNQIVNGAPGHEPGFYADTFDNLKVQIKRRIVGIDDEDVAPDTTRRRRR